LRELTKAGLTLVLVNSRRGILVGWEQNLLGEERNSIKNLLLSTFYHL